MGGHSSSGGGGAPSSGGTKKDAIVHARRNEPNIVEKLINMSPTVKVIKAIGKKLEESAYEHNLKSRRKYVAKHNVKVPPSERIDESDEFLGSKEGLAMLRDTGYTTAGDKKPDRDGPHSDIAETQIAKKTPKSIEQPKVPSQMDNTDVKSKMIIAKGPTDIELTEDERLMKIKRKGRKRTTLTNITGAEEKPTLSERILLA